MPPIEETAQTGLKPQPPSFIPWDDPRQRGRFTQRAFPDSYPPLPGEMVPRQMVSRQMVPGGTRKTRTVSKSTSRPSSYKDGVTQMAPNEETEHLMAEIDRQRKDIKAILKLQAQRTELNQDVQSALCSQLQAATSLFEEEKARYEKKILVAQETESALRLSIQSLQQQNLDMMASFVRRSDEQETEAQDKMELQRDIGQLRYELGNSQAHMAKAMQQIGTEKEELRARLERTQKERDEAARFDEDRRQKLQQTVEQAERQIFTLGEELEPLRAWHQKAQHRQTIGFGDALNRFRLDTSFTDDGRTRHLHAAVGSSARNRQRITEEIWERKGMLGYGSYGRVFLEERTVRKGPARPQVEDDDHLRAVKVIDKHPGIRPINLRRELEAIALFSQDRFAHCFVRALGWFDDGDDHSICIAMEYVRHGDLQRYLPEAPFPETEARQVAVQIIEGLGFMHANGFAHRDLKPGNILIHRRGPGWWVKIGDFGIAKRTGAAAMTALKTFEIGSMAYMAPEVSGMCLESNASQYTDAVDVWAVGEITHRMLTGQASFEDRNLVGGYVYRSEAFPETWLERAGVSGDGREFVKMAMVASPKTRMTVKEALKHAWTKAHVWIDSDNTEEESEPRFVEPHAGEELDEVKSWTSSEDGDDRHPPKSSVADSRMSSFSSFIAPTSK